LRRSTQGAAVLHNPGFSQACADAAALQSDGCHRAMWDGRQIKGRLEGRIMGGEPAEPELSEVVVSTCGG
jgi:hypothetical protein